jgi:capsular polysaccharide biosynthesis protein
VSPASEFIVTAPAPRSGGRQLGVRLAESLFRHWLLLLVPILLLTSLGVVKALGLTGQYRSVGTVSVVSATFLSDLSDVRTNSVGFQSPAEQTAASINEQLTSDSFARDVGVGAGLTTAMGNGQITLDDIRSIVSAAPRGDTLLAVVATSDNPELSSRLATSLITTYTNFVLSRETGESSASAAFYQGQVDKYTAAVTDAQNAISAFITASPEPLVGARPESEQLQLTRLTATLTQAQSQLDSAQSKLDDSNLATETSASDISQRLQVVDQPEPSAAPESVRRDQLATVIIFLFLGALISLSMWVGLALLDHTVRSAGDVTAIGLAVVATIQKVRPAAPGPSLDPHAFEAGAIPVHLTPTSGAT